MSESITEEDVVRTAQAVQRDRRELLGLLSDVADSVVADDEGGSAIAHLGPSLVAEIRRRTSHEN